MSIRTIMIITINYQPLFFTLLFICVVFESVYYDLL